MKHRKTRPADARPGSNTNARELGERLRASRERLAGSELANSGQAWRLWAACADATVGYAREADLIYMSTLAREADVHRTNAGPILQRFDELGVFGWTAAPRGSRAISELRLLHVAPGLHDTAHMHRPGYMNSDKAHQSCSPHGALQPLPTSMGSTVITTTHRDAEPEETSAETGTPAAGTPQKLRALESLPRAELDVMLGRAIRESDDATFHAVRDELHRRDVSKSAMARFGVF